VAREDAFTVEGTVTEVISDRLFRLELRNGHRLLAHGSAKWKQSQPEVRIGDRLSVLVSLFDLSKGAVQF
jgi:translation initiation factor IF-1